MKLLSMLLLNDATRSVDARSKRLIFCFGTDGRCLLTIIYGKLKRHKKGEVNPERSVGVVGIKVVIKIEAGETINLMVASTTNP